MTVWIHAAFDALLCPEQAHENNCVCDTLRRHYGARLFMCTYPACPFNRQGFQSKHDRDLHLTYHSQPWKCFSSPCPFSARGFDSREKRDKHWREKHQIPEPLGLECSQLDEDQLQPLIFETVKMGNVEQLQQLLLHPLAQESFLAISDAKVLAAKLGSLPMVELLNLRHSLLSSEFFEAAVQSGDVSLFRWLLDQSKNILQRQNYSIFATAVLKADCQTIYDMWETRFLAGEADPGEKEIYTSNRSKAVQLMPEWEMRSVVLLEPCFNAVKQNPQYETRLIQTWDKLAKLGYLKSAPLGYALTRLAYSSCSVLLAEALLRLGADVNFPRREKSDFRGMTALHIAARKDSAAAAEFMRFLLQKGADPNHPWADRNASMERGALGISKWLGLTWEELVKISNKKKSGRLDGADRCLGVGEE